MGGCQWEWDGEGGVEGAGEWFEIGETKQVAREAGNDLKYLSSKGIDEKWLVSK